MTEVRCPKCGKESPEGARFCRNCGEQFAASGPGAGAPRMMTPEERARRTLEEAFRFSEEGRLQAAIQTCQQAINLNPRSTSAHSLLGTLYERIGDRDGAIRAYEQVLTLSPGSTVERRRLNELMGVGAPPTEVGLTPQRTRMAVTGGFVVVALILVAAIIFTTQQPGPERRGPAARAAGVTQAARPAARGGDVAPARLVTSGRTRPPRAVAQRPQAATPRQQQQAPARSSYGQWIGPGTFVLPAGGQPAYGGLGAAGRTAYVPPMEGAIPLRGARVPTVKTPQWRYTGSGEVLGAAATPRLARDQYYQGHYQSSINAYETYLRQNPQATASRQELAWVYSQAGQSQTARQEYEVALDQYREDMRRGVNVESARHGERTCESAIRTLETE